MVSPNAAKSASLVTNVPCRAFQRGYFHQTILNNCHESINRHVGQFPTLHIRGNGLGIGLGLALLLYFMNIIANIAEPASFLKYITPFGYTEAADIIADGSLSAVKLLIGLGIALAGILLAFRKYSEKDLK